MTAARRRTGWERGGAALWYLLYRLFYLLAVPPMVLRLWWRGRRDPIHRQDLKARFGRVAPGPSDGIWIHAGGAGGVLTAAPLVQRLRRERPEIPLVVTVGTASGRARAERLLPAEVRVTWMPWDLPSALHAFLARVRPRLLVLLETELWPVQLRECRASGVAAILADARISEAALANLSRLGSFSRVLVDHLDRIVCQDAATAERFRILGADGERLDVVGSLSYDLHPPADLEAQAERARAALRGAAAGVVVAGGTARDEEAPLLDALLPVIGRHAGWRLVIAPCSADRYEAVWRRLHAIEGAWRSSEGPAPADARVVLADSTFGLLALYAVADVAIIGGSLEPRADQDPAEPAWCGVPVVAGPYVDDFSVVAEGLRQEGALEMVAGSGDLAEVVERLIADPAERARRGRLGRDRIRRQGRALERLVSLILEVHARARIG